MLRVQYRRYGGPEELELAEFDQIQPEQDQMRVRVKAASVNPMDWKIRAGVMKMMTGSTFPRGIGTDFAGIVDAVGPAVTRFKVGDEVFGAMSMRGAGSFAETVVTGEKSAVIKPASLSFEDAATLPIAGGTAWAALVGKAHLKRGQSVFVNGCLGGVGRAAVQIARMLGAEVAGSCSAAGIEEAHALGVTTVVDYRCLDLKKFQNRFDVVFDTAGSLSTKQCAGMLQSRGIALHIVINGTKIIAVLLTPHQSIVFGETTPEILTTLGKAAAEGKLIMAIGERVSLEKAIPALTVLEKTGSPKGKLVIIPA